MIEIVTTLLLAVGVYALLRRPGAGCDAGCDGGRGGCEGEPVALVQLGRPRGRARR
ncbi:conserved hypothetical protein [Anaeromyxobacter dehalogenans 2CP-1]|uniref:FeoB-associated Cys-rich membrane protein n=1 Tax=Anaeromyxobacter dehalogenans (strain ATCC BAA-258 / DSM 21875 / 2CP-1) TaxID=455488 RepID=B8JA13_ANAD2|nr:hypothetical protein [Anaeromyxobacter dehalogenans]ACL63716.1 conserved hypothetical protein [Anaeromyxobacter dehalogenans 2CP-1]